MLIRGWRRIEARDLGVCVEIQPAPFGPEHTRLEAFAVWQALLRSPAFDGVVVLGSDSRGDSRIVGFGSAVFVSTAFIEEELKNPRPHLSYRVVDSAVTNHSVILSDSELSANNSNGGLDMVVLASRWAEDLSFQEAREVQLNLEKAFLKLFLGFRLRRLVAEVTDRDVASYAEKSGVWRVVKEFPGEEKPDHAQRDSFRALIMTDRESALAVPMSAAGFLFDVNPPSLGLRPTDQELLLAALKGSTDQELASELSLTEEAIKRRWSVLFDRVGRAKPELISEASVSTSACTPRGQRGPQKRHRILAYVRDHPEELRPFKLRTP